jgi:DNA-directed RNA polymerase subunit RPC12/RpoP
VRDVPRYNCAKCGHEVDRSPFRVTCPNCGARLVSRVDEADERSGTVR